MKKNCNIFSPELGYSTLSEIIEQFDIESVRDIVYDKTFGVECTFKDDEGKHITIARLGDID